MDSHFEISHCLPDDLLLSIFSLLPIQSIARAGAVSKRWNHLFHHLIINPLSLEFRQHIRASSGAFRFEKPIKELVGSVGLSLRLLGHNKLKRFKLTIIPDIPPLPEIQNWLHCVVEKGVEELVLDFRFQSQPLRPYQIDDEKFMLPPTVFQSNTIAHLLVCRFDFTVPVGFTGLKLLTKLQLITVNIQDEMLDSILANCSLIEVLQLRRCRNLANVRIRGTNLRLKSLAILDINTQLLEVSGPNLGTFHYNGESDVFNITNVNSLVDAIVCANAPFGYAPLYRRVRLLGMLRNVQILAICSVIIEDMHILGDDNFAIQLIIFTKLRELQILFYEGLTEEITMKGFSNLFRRCSFPLLEKLFINFENEGFNSSSRVKPGYELSVPDELLYKLRVVKITNFHGYMNEIEVVKFLLQTGIALEFLVLVAVDDNDQDGSLRKHLGYVLQHFLLLPKASSEAQIVMYNYGDEGISFFPTKNETDWDLDDYWGLDIGFYK